MSKWIEIGAIVLLAIIAIRVISDYLANLGGGTGAGAPLATPQYVNWVAPQHRYRYVRGQPVGKGA
jgi:hypothetical protein